jgi:glycosyltransferase involved in cell wall biosynthesis
MSKICYSVVIPCYNSSETLEKLSLDIIKTFEEIDKTFELILVNDGSPKSKSWDIIKSLSQNFKPIKSVNLSRNFGQQSATLCGMSIAKGDYIITMDDDGQHEPSDIKKLIEFQEHDMVIARLRSRKDSLLRQISSKLKSYFDYIVLNKPKHIRLSPFRLLNKRVVNDMLNIKTNTPFIPALMFIVSRDVVNVDVEHYERLKGVSNYNFIKRLGLFTLIVINNSSIILRFCAYFGVFCAIGSLFLATFIVSKIALHGSSYQPGWASLFSAILFFGGLNLIMLGLVGEYLVRLFRGVESRPAFLIKEIID